MTVHYERLSNLDASFLALESRSTHMHVGAVAVFEPGPHSSLEGVDIDTIRALVASRLHQIPRYRQRLATVPVEGHPVWVDDDHFHIEYHVRHTALPHPGTDEQLKALAGRLMSQQLDRTRPLWELNVVEGLASGGFALVGKVHHCMIDGISGVDLMSVILDFTPAVEIRDAEPWEPRPAPNGTELAVKEISRSISRFVGGLTDLSGLVADVGAVRDDVSHRLRAVAASLGSGWLTSTGRTPLNGSIGPSRFFDWLDLPLDEVKAIKNEHGVTVNDAMLAIVAGGVRRYLLTEGAMTESEVAQTEFRIMAPVSVRTETQQGTLGNQVAMWLMALPVGEPDPARRITAIRDETQTLKETDQALGASTLVQVSTGAPMTLVSLAARLASGIRPFNMTVTNVPGPQFPMYLVGSEMIASYPLVPLWQSHGAGVAMFSLNGRIDIGLNMDRTIVEHPDALRKAIWDAFEELKDARAAAEPEPKGATGPKKAPPMGTR